MSGDESCKLVVRCFRNSRGLSMTRTYNPATRLSCLSRACLAARIGCFTLCFAFASYAATGRRYQATCTSAALGFERKHVLDARSSFSNAALLRRVARPPAFLHCHRAVNNLDRYHRTIQCSETSVVWLSRAVASCEWPLLPGNIPQRLASLTNGLHTFLGCGSAAKTS